MSSAQLLTRVVVGASSFFSVATLRLLLLSIARCLVMRATTLVGCLGVALDAGGAGGFEHGFAEARDHMIVHASNLIAWLELRALIVVTGGHEHVLQGLTIGADGGARGPNDGIL